MKKTVILSLVAASMLAVTGCGDDAKKAAENTAGAVNKTAEHAVANTKEAAGKVADSTKEAAHKTVEKAKEAVDVVKDKAKETSEVAMKKAEEAKKAVADTADKAKEAVAKVTGVEGNGAALFAKCAGCHGTSGEKQALSKSEVIKGWDAAKTEKALLEYKAGTRNVHGMGSLMKGQVDKLSDEDIKTLAGYIATLK